MNTTTQTPEARQEAFICQIEGTREAVEAYGRTESEAHFDAYETARRLVTLRGDLLHADLTMLQEMKMHKELTRLVRQAEKLQAEVERFQAKMQAAEKAIYKNW